MSATTTPGLGRIVAPDIRDEPYRLRALGLVGAEPRPRRTKVWPMFAKWIDQGQTGTCVGHGWRSLLTGTPRPRRDPLPTPFQIYDAAIAIDEWASNDNDTARQFGTSVRAGARVLQALGLLTSYGWADDVDTAVDWLCWHGPMVGGFNWYSSFYERDKSGFLSIAPGARVAGGHCFLIQGWDERRGAAVCLNSWATYGRFLLSGETFERLLREDGECATPVEIGGKP